MTAVFMVGVMVCSVNVQISYDLQTFFFLSVTVHGPFRVLISKFTGLAFLGLFFGRGGFELTRII